MTTAGLYRLQKDLIRHNFFKYLRRAYENIPPIEKPNILDIGCGTGVPTLELLEISGGAITGIDNDSGSLDILKAKVEKHGYEDKVTVINISVEDVDVEDETFDIVWAEGSLFIYGFEESLKNWRHWIKPKGCLVTHDDAENYEQKISSIPELGYKLLTHFELNERIWWIEYYSHLEKLIKQTIDDHPNDNALKKVVKPDQGEIELFHRQAVKFRSFYAVMQKV